MQNKLTKIPKEVLPAENRLTDKEERFVLLYTTNGFNANQAALDAGYTQGGKSFGLLRNRKVQMRIRELMEPALQSAGISREKLILELQGIINGKPTDVVDIKEGRVTLKDSIDTDSRMIKRIAFKEDEKGRMIAVDFPDKLKAIELLLKALGADKKEINVKFGPDAEAFEAYENTKSRMLREEVDENIIEGEIVE